MSSKRPKPPSRPSKQPERLTPRDFEKFIPKAIDPDREREWLAGQARREADERREQRKTRLELASRDLELDDELKDALINEATLLQTPSLEAAKAWLGGHPKPWLVLAGSTGCGKSAAAAWIFQLNAARGSLRPSTAS
jgi:transcriptional regulator with AAA-type ATPase domain